MRSAVVVGAGVGGLAAAGALSRSGWRVTLIERAERLGGAKAALVVWPNGVRALDLLGLGPGFGDISFPLPAGGIRRPDGRWLVAAEAAAATANAAPDGTSEAEPAAAPVVVHGEDLYDALMAGLGEGVEIHTGTEVTTVRSGPYERPAVGTAKHVWEADLIVAADGAHSAIRRRLAPQSVATSAGYTAWRAVIPWFRAPKLPDSVPAAGEMLGAGQRFLHAGLGERGSAGAATRGGIYWAATAPGAPRPEGPETQLSLLRRWFAGWQAPVGELLAATEPQDLMQQPGEEVIPLPSRFGFPVGVGGFALLGDAAHVATPNLAQGACLAFEDAATLRSLVMNAIPGRTLGAALEEYTQLRRPRVARVARTSRRLGRVLQARGRLAVRARDAALGALPARFLDRAAATSVDWNPPL